MAFKYTGKAIYWDPDPHGQVRGKSSEQRVLWLLQTFPVSFIKSARAATRQEDQERATDVVIDTDVGELYIQVKSSRYGGYKRYRRISKQVRRRLCVVVAGPSFSDEQVLYSMCRSINSVRHNLIPHLKKHGVKIEEIRSNKNYERLLVHPTNSREHLADAPNSLR